MKATRAFYDRTELPDGAIVEMSIWRVPSSVVGSAHVFKYSLFYGKSGQRIVGYDNERARGITNTLPTRKSCICFLQSKN
jgi:hypothetical protein